MEQPLIWTAKPNRSFSEKRTCSKVLGSNIEQPISYQSPLFKQKCANVFTNEKYITPVGKWLNKMELLIQPKIKRFSAGRLSLLQSKGWNQS